MSDYSHETNTSGCETGRGIARYASELGFSSDEFTALIANRRILDLGSGRGMFGYDVAVAKKMGEPAPRQVISVNSRYAREDYLSEHRQWLRQQGMQDNELWEEVRQGWRANRWEHIGEIMQNEEPFDVVLSVVAFPHYSDFYQTGFTRMGSQSKDIFEQLFQVSRRILCTTIPEWIWNQNPEFQYDVWSFFNETNIQLHEKIVSSVVVFDIHT